MVATVLGAPINMGDLLHETIVRCAVGDSSAFEGVELGSCWINGGLFIVGPTVTLSREEIRLVVDRMGEEFINGRLSRYDNLFNSAANVDRFVTDACTFGYLYRWLDHSQDSEIVWVEV